MAEENEMAEDLCEKETAPACENADAAEKEDKADSTLVKAAKNLKKAIAMCHIGEDAGKTKVLLDAVAICNIIIDYDNVRMNLNECAERAIRRIR